jgi:hypothetical protein
MTVGTTNGEANRSNGGLLKNEGILEAGSSEIEERFSRKMGW